MRFPESYAKRYEFYPHRENVKRVRDVDERALFRFLLSLDPDSYGAQLNFEVERLFKKASSAVRHNIIMEIVIKPKLIDKIQITTDDARKRYQKFELTHAGLQKYPELRDFQRASFEYWLNYYVEKEFIDQSEIASEFKHYLKTQTVKTKPSETIGKVRPDFIENNVLLGRQIEIIMPDDTRHKSQFAIVDLDNIVASHNEENFENSYHYPVDNRGYNINDRNYKDDINAQGEVIRYAQNLQPDRLITTSRTPSGTPIITTDGFVVSGNNRTMSLKLAEKNYPEKYEQYKKFLLEEISAFGIKDWVISAILMGESIPGKNSSYHNPTYVKIKKPVLVRIDYDFPEYTTAELAKYNKDTKKAERPIDKVIKLSNIFRDNEGCKLAIANTIGEFETLTEFYISFNSQNKVINSLIECSIITQQEKPSYFDTSSGFNSQGKDFIEMLLAAIVLDRDALLTSEKEGVKRYRNLILTVLPILIKNTGLPEGNLRNEINQAILLESKSKSGKLSFQEYIRQIPMFEEKPSKNVMYINRLFESGRKSLKDAIDKYNTAVINNQEESLFGEKPSLEEIFNTFIIKTVEKELPEDAKIIEQFGVVPNTNEPQKNDDELELLELESEAQSQRLRILSIRSKKMDNGGLIENSEVGGNYHMDNNYGSFTSIKIMPVDEKLKPSKDYFTVQTTVRAKKHKKELLQTKTKTFSINRYKDFISDLINRGAKKIN